MYVIVLECSNGVKVAWNNLYVTIEGAKVAGEHISASHDSVWNKSYDVVDYKIYELKEVK